MTVAQSNPLIAPTLSSLLIIACLFESLICPNANPLIINVNVWLPDIPPIEATTGMSTAKATTCCKVASNSPINQEAKKAVTKLIPNQIARFLLLNQTLENKSSSSLKPAD